MLRASHCMDFSLPTEDMVSYHVGAIKDDWLEPHPQWSMQSRLVTNSVSLLAILVAEELWILDTAAIPFNL